MGASDAEALASTLSLTTEELHERLEKLERAQRAAESRAALFREMALRLKYAGVPEDRITVEPDLADGDEAAGGAAYPCPGGGPSLGHAARDLCLRWS